MLGGAAVFGVVIALFAAWADEAQRSQWFPDFPFTVRKATANKSLRLGAADGALIGVSVVAWITNHRTAGFFVFRRPTEGWEYLMNLTAAFFAVACLGAGEWSLDHAVGFEPGGWWGLGLAAVIATAHDILTTIAFMKLLHLEISLTVVAALLTVLGYSLNDTIIIFDRVRENLRKNRKEALYDVLNRSVNETLPRSILTHATALAATLALLFFAGEVIRPFAWVMTFGIFTGTFSSIFVASPILMWVEQKWPRANEARGAQAAARA